jgi:heme A synthase
MWCQCNGAHIGHVFVNKETIFTMYGDLNHSVYIIHRITDIFLTFIGLCIVIYSYSKTNRMHLFLKLFILAKHTTCFGRSFRPS